MAGAEPVTPSGAAAATHQDTHHEEWEWEAQREHFTLYYKAQNKTLKAAMQLMIANHNFAATHRQWERKIKEWNLQKYTSRQARIEEIQQQGRSMEEIAELGRRSASGNLQPKDDRNLRRFARRELNRSTSRSRSRSRSQSFGNGRLSRSTTPVPAVSSPRASRKISAPEPVHLEDIFGLQVLSTDQLRSYYAEPEMLSEIPRSVPHSIDQTSHLFPDPHNMLGGQTNDIDTNSTSEVNNIYLAVPGHDQTAAGNVLTDSSYAYRQPDESMSTTSFPDIDMTTLSMGGSESMPTPPTPFPSVMDDSTWKTPVLFSTDTAHSHTPVPLPQGGILNESSADSQTFLEGLSTPSNNISPPPPASQEKFDSLPVFTYQPAGSPHLGASDSGFPPPGPLPGAVSRQSDDPNIYDDCYGSVNRHTQQIHDTIFQLCKRLGAADEEMRALQHELEHYRANLTFDLTMHINSFASAKDRALGAMRANLNVLRSRISQAEMGSDNQGPTAGGGSVMTQPQQPFDEGIFQHHHIDQMSVSAVHGHRFSLPESNSRRSMVYGT